MTRLPFDGPAVIVAAADIPKRNTDSEYHSISVSVSALASVAIVHGETSTPRRRFDIREVLEEVFKRKNWRIS